MTQYGSDTWGTARVRVWLIYLQPHWRAAKEVFICHAKWSGDEVPMYKPVAALATLTRSIEDRDL